VRSGRSARSSFRCSFSHTRRCANACSVARKSPASAARRSAF
jgi:hypothetical protein